MRILWIDPLNTNPHYLNLMAVVLREAGHEVRVCSLEREHFAPPHGIDWVPFARLAEPVFTFHNRPLAAAGLVARYPFHWRRAIRFAGACRVRAVIVSTNLMLRRIDAWAMRRLQRSGLFTLAVVHKPWQTYHADKQAKASHKAFYRHADRVLAMDEHTRAILRSACDVPEERLRHLPFPHCGPILSAVKPTESLARSLANWATPAGGSPAPVIAFLSQMREEHGFADLLTALSTLNAEFGAWRLLVVSSNAAAKQRAAVQRWLTDCGLHSRCWLHWDRYSAADLKAFLGAASLVVTPYKWAGRSIVLSIAAGAGVPVVTTDIGDLAIGIRSGVNGELAAPGRPAELAAAIATVLRDLPRYRRGARDPHTEFAPHRAANALTSALREAGA